MNAKYLGLLLCAAISAPVSGGERAADAPGEGFRIPAAVQASATPVKLELAIAPLGQTPQAPLLADTPAGADALAAVTLPALETAPGLVAPERAPGTDTAGKLLGWSSPEASADFTQPSAQAPGLETQVDSGRRQFDVQSSKYALPASAPSVRRWLADLWKGADNVPAWPGKEGDALRLDGKTFTLERRLGEGNSAIVWKGRDRGNDVAVKFIHPEFKNIPLYGAEVEALEALGRTDIPHAQLLARSGDGLVIVKRYLDGPKASEVIAQGDLNEHQRTGFAELAARLIRIGYTADIHPNNLIWEKWRTRYSLADAGGFAPGRPWSVLKQLLEDAPVRSGAVSARQILSGVRGRLGPYSTGWKRVLEDGASHPELARALAELFAYDRSLTPAPRPALGPAAADPVLNDSVVTAGQLRKKLGYDPLLVSPRRMLHGDDPGKLNTKVFQIEPAGGKPVVVKIAEWDIIKREVAMRRVVRSFFGTAFQTPGSLAVRNGYDSYMVMSVAEGSKSFSHDPMDRFHRVAMSLLAQTFGLYDVNRGNVLSKSSREVTLIDFEQSLSRRTPVASRVPDRGIAEEMPWTSLEETNHIEDYLPAIQDWRAVFLSPRTQAQLEVILRESGFDAAEIPGVLAQLKANAADLEWALQNDVEFANLFVQRRAPR